MKTKLIVAFLTISSVLFSQQVYNTTNDSLANADIVFMEVTDTLLADLLVFRVDSLKKMYKDGTNFLEMEFPSGID